MVPWSSLIAQSASVPLQWLDVLVLTVSVVGVTAFGMWIGRKEDNTSDYYLAGKTVAWWAVAGSIFGTNISSHHMVGMMGAGLKEGFAQANFEFGAIFGLLMLCYFFLPFYRRMGLYTLSEYLGRRFDDRSRLVYSITNMAFLLIQMVGTMILGALTIATLTADSRLRDQLRAGRLRAGRRGRRLHVFRRAEGRHLQRRRAERAVADRQRHAGRAGHLASQRRRNLGLAGKTAREVPRVLRRQPSRSFPGAACSAG